MEARLGPGSPPGQQGCLGASWLLWFGGLDDGARIKGSAVGSGVQLQEEGMVLETDEARTQLDCKAALRGERAAWACLAFD